MKDINEARLFILDDEDYDQEFFENLEVEIEEAAGDSADQDL